MISLAILSFITGFYCCYRYLNYSYRKEAAKIIDNAEAIVDKHRIQCHKALMEKMAELNKERQSYEAICLKTDEINKELQMYVDRAKGMMGSNVPPDRIVWRDGYPRLTIEEPGREGRA